MMGAFELPLLIIVWVIALCLATPIVLAVLVLIIGAVSSVLIKLTDSDNLLDKVKPPEPVNETKPNNVKQTYSCSNDKTYEAKRKKEITFYINANYSDKYPTFADFYLIRKEFSYLIILKDKDGNVLGEEEISLSDLWELQEEYAGKFKAIQRFIQLKHL